MSRVPRVRCGIARWLSSLARRAVRPVLAAGCISAALLWAGTGFAASPERHTLWEVKGKHNTVYLLGSIHMLKPSQSDLPDVALRAYQDSTSLVMELNLNDLSEEGLVGGDTDLETLPAGQTLRDQIGAGLYAKVQSRAQGFGLDAELLDHFQPWFAALLLQQMQLAKSGFDPSSGVDMQFASRAEADHKTIVGLETLNQQLEVFAQLPMAQQREYLQSTLDDADDENSQTDEVIRAWKSGDTQSLEALLKADSTESPELLRRLTVDRNRNWLPKLDELLNQDGNVLVVVGALHLIGQGGLIDLLQRQGYSPVQR